MICPTCDGHREIDVSDLDHARIWVPCPTCDGFGDLVPCPACNDTCDHCVHEDPSAAGWVTPTTADRLMVNEPPEEIDPRDRIVFITGEPPRAWRFADV